MRNNTVSAERGLSRRKSTKFRLDIDPKSWKDFMSAVQNGVSFDNACWSSGLKPMSVRKWLEKGELLQDEDLPPEYQAWQYVRFYLDFMKARAEFERLHATNINSKAVKHLEDSPGDWKASAWQLERHSAARYSPQYKIEQQAKQKAVEVIRYIFESASPEFAAELATILKDIPMLADGMGDAL